MKITGNSSSGYNISLTTNELRIVYSDKKFFNKFIDTFKALKEIAIVFETSQGNPDNTLISILEENPK